ncbi:MAG: ABC transporter ATP-binding protein [Verrucomicrobiota bacterium]
MTQTIAKSFVSVRNLEKRFGDGPIVLDDINLEVKSGDFISLLGPSGCGKSTLLKALCGLLEITSGSINIDGMTPENAREIAFFIFQEPSLLPWLRVAGNVELPLKIQGASTENRKAKAEKMIELVGLSDAAKKFPWQLSGGMKMRVSIARALTTSPKLLMLDEPFGALDEMTRDRLNEDLLKIREVDPFTAFFVTHSVAEAVFLSSKIVILSANPGRVAEVIDVPFDFPRSAPLRESTEYLEILAKTTHALRAVEEQ